MCVCFVRVKLGTDTSIVPTEPLLLTHIVTLSLVLKSVSNTNTFIQLIHSVSLSKTNTHNFQHPHTHGLAFSHTHTHRHTDTHTHTHTIFTLQAGTHTIKHRLNLISKSQKKSLNKAEVPDPF